MTSAVLRPSRGPVTALEARWGLLLSAPYIIGLLVFCAGPIIFSWIIGFFEWDKLTPPHFVGLGNWQRLLHDDLFWKSLGNTLFYVVGTVPVGIILSLLLAMVVNQPLRGVTFFRTIYFTPVVTSTVAVSLVWSWFYDPNYGVLNFLIDSVYRLTGHQAPPAMGWLSNPRTALPAIMVMSVWKGLGYNMVIFLAALQSVPRYLYEAAELDGAGAVGKFFHVTWPTISPVTFFVLVISLIGSFQVFDQVYVMARDGRPADSTLTTVYYLYKHAFQYLEMGYASVIGTTLFLIILAITLVQLAMQKRWVHY